MIKIQNMTDTNKRIRLIALDSAMSNIDDSVGAIAKDGRDILLCLAPKAGISCAGAIDEINILIDKFSLMEFQTLYLRDLESEEYIISALPAYGFDSHEAVLDKLVELLEGTGLSATWSETAELQYILTLRNEGVVSRRLSFAFYQDSPILSTDIDGLPFNETSLINEDRQEVTFCLSPMVEEQPTISCADSPSSIVLPLTGGAYYEIVDGDAVYGSMFRHLMVGAGDATYFEGLRFEAVTGDEINPITVRVVNLTDNPKRIKFTALDANYLNESYFAEKGLNYTETALAHNVESLDNGLVFEFCLGPTGEDGDDEEQATNEMHFTTTEGSVDYVGNQGDQILLSDGAIVDVTVTDRTLTFNAPSGKHKVKLVESVDRSNYVSVGGEALVELHNFPTLSTVTKFNFSTREYNDVPNLTKIPEFFPSNITDIEYLFYYATNFNQDISMWDVSNVTNMNGMFHHAFAFDQDISMWDTSSVTDMGSMFLNAEAFDQPLGNWNVSNVTDMGNMFNTATSFDQPLGNWNVSNVTDMNGMFYEANSFNQPLNSWNVSNVTNMGGMFNGAFAFDQDISMWDTSNVLDMSYMFGSATAFNQDISGWNTSNVTNMGNMFNNAEAFDQPLGNWNVSNVTDMNYMFHHATAFDQDISSWDVSDVLDMSYMFYDAIEFNQDISGWDVSNVISMTFMFGGASAFDQDLSQWCVSNIVNPPTYFDYGATNWTLPRPVWGTCPRGENLV